MWRKVFHTAHASAREHMLESKKKTHASRSQALSPASKGSHQAGAGARGVAKALPSLQPQPAGRSDGAACAVSTYKRRRAGRASGDEM
jgi:hypothetical protein